MNYLGRIICLLGILPLFLFGCPPTSTAGDDDDNDDGADDDAGDDDSSSPELYGPENSWWHAFANDVPDGLAGTGWGNGDVANNFVLADQFGDELELYQFYGQVIVLDNFAEW